MDLKLLRRLLKLAKESGVAELEVETQDLRVYIKQQPDVQEKVAYIPDATTKTEVHKEEDRGDEKREEAFLSGKLVRVSAPMVGTFYRAPSPESPPFVNVGDRVKKGQVLCIIEAMKLMNEIESEYEGVIKEILVENGSPVQYGDVLFIIETD